LGHLSHACGVGTMNWYARWNPFLPITLDRRRRRLRLGVAFFSIIIFAFLAVALMGPDRHITLMMSLAIWPTLVIFIVQWARVRTEILKHGPDHLEQPKPAPGELLATTIGALIIAVAIGGILVLSIIRQHPVCTSQTNNSKSCR